MSSDSFWHILEIIVVMLGLIMRLPPSPAQYFCNPSNLDGRVYVRFRVRVGVSVRVRVCCDNVSDTVIYV